MNTTDQKIKYEEKKEQERKRRFAILSGNIKPIQTTFHLKSEEQAYYQCPAQRMADKEYSQFYTSGKSKAPFIQGGILRGSYQVSTETEQVRSTRSVVIDNGTLLFTNRKILFVGEKQVVEVHYDDILAVYFSSSALIIKYPQMLPGEQYECNSEEAELYYQGVQRMTGRDKSVAKLEDVKLNWVEFEDPDKKDSERKWYKSNVISIILLFLFFPVGLFMMWRFTKWNKKMKWAITIIGAFVYLIFLIGANSSPTQQSSGSQKTVPAKAQDKGKPTANVYVPTMTPVQTYMSAIMKLQFDQMGADTSDISSHGVTKVKFDTQERLKASQDILHTLNTLQVPQEMADVQSSLLSSVNLSIQANNQFLQALTTNNISDITTAKNMFTQADAEITQGEKLLFGYEQEQFGSFATLTFDFNGVTIKNNFDVPISNCTIYLGASEKHWSDPWDYEADEQATTDGYYINIPAKKTLSVKWEHITDAGNSSFTYPPDKPYDVQFSCDIFNVSQQIPQTIQSQ